MGNSGKFVGVYPEPFHMENNGNIATACPELSQMEIIGRVTFQKIWCSFGLLQNFSQF